MPNSVLMGESVMPHLSFSSSAVTSSPFLRYSRMSFCPSSRLSLSAFCHTASSKGCSRSRESRRFSFLKSLRRSCCFSSSRPFSSIFRRKSMVFPPNSACTSSRETCSLSPMKSTSSLSFGVILISASKSSRLTDQLLFVRIPAGIIACKH